MTTTTLDDTRPRNAPWGWLALALVLWIAAYWNLTPFADALLSLTGLDRNTHTGEAVHFFLYDTPKVLLLLTGIVFAMGIDRRVLSGHRGYLPARRQCHHSHLRAGACPGTALLFARGC